MDWQEIGGSEDRWIQRRLEEWRSTLTDQKIGGQTGGQTDEEREDGQETPGLTNAS